MRVMLGLVAMVMLNVPANQGVPAGAYVPERVVDTAAGTFTDFEAMAASLAKADVVLVGEQHDDPNTHRLELAVLEALARRRGGLVLSLEMFERDVQGRLDQFVRGQLPEPEFLATSRPWPRYASDYKPLVDLAAARQWPVVAANVPRPVASEVSKNGLGVLAGKPASERAWAARELRCTPQGEYFDRFGRAMGSHPGEGDEAAKRLSAQRFYEAQCLKDETMAESIAAAHAAASTADTRAIVVHMNGAFHSDFHLGTAERVARRMPNARVAVITMMPVADLDAIELSGEDLRRADYLVFTVKR